MKTNQIIHADCMDVVELIPSKSIDLILTDIPYGEVNRKDNGLRSLDKGCADTVDFDLNKLMTELIRVNSGSIYIFCGTEQVSQIRSCLANRNYSTRLIIWEKTNPSPMNGQSIWLSGIECCVFGKLKGATFNERCKNTVLRYPVCQGKSRIHPTQKPLSLIKYLIEVSSDEKDTVLDCFSGSGTTAIACLQTNRNYICIEKDKTFYEQSLERLNRELINF